MADIISMILCTILSVILVGVELSDTNNKRLMEHYNIGEFNKGQSSKIIRKLVEDDSAAFVQKNGKPIAVIISYERYQRMFENGIDISEF